jgi:hypothetical protein
MNKPVETKDIIEKEVALICLNWAQARLDEQKAVFTKARLSYQSHKIIDELGDPAIIHLELRPSTDSTDRMPSKGSMFKFRSVNEKEWLKVPEVRFDLKLFINFLFQAKLYDIKDGVVMLKMCLWRANSKTGNERLQRIIWIKNECVDVHADEPDFIPQSMLRSIGRIKSGELNHIISPTPNFQVDLNRFIFFICCL